jgi:hypothetical protein
MAALIRLLFRRAARRPPPRRPPGRPPADRRPPERPETVQPLPSGRFPPNSAWAGRRYNGHMWTRELQRKYPNGVRFDAQGYPVFGPYARAAVRFRSRRGYNGDATDVAPANRAAGFRETPNGWVWHHHQDGFRMQLIPRDLHDAIRHAGAAATR